MNLWVVYMAPASVLTGKCTRESGFWEDFKRRPVPRDFNVCRVPCSEVVQIGEICFCYIITKKYQTLSSKCGKMTQCNCMIKIAINYLTWTCRKVLWSPLQMLILLTHPICQSKIQKHISFLNVGTDKDKTDIRKPQVSEDRRVTGTLRSAWPASLILTIWPS